MTISQQRTETKELRFPPKRRGGLAGAWRLPTENLISVLLVLIFAVLILPPLFVLVYSSLKDSGQELPFDVPGFSLGNFSFIIHNPATVTVLGNTVVYVLGSALLGIALSLVLTYLIERTDMPGRNFFRTVILSPMAVPAIVMAIAWTFFANPTNGPLSRLIHAVFSVTPSIYSLYGMILVTAILSVPSTYLLISPQFARFDASFEDAAATSGASWWRRTRRVVLPLLSPAILSAAMLIVVISLESFDVPAILGFPHNTYLFSTLIQQELQPPNGSTNYGGASALGLLLVIVAIALAVVYRRRVKASHRFRTVTGKGFRPAVVRLGRWRNLAAAGVGLYCLVGLVLPLVVLLLTSLLPYFSLSGKILSQASFSNYVSIFESSTFIQGAGHTLVIMLAAATITTILAYAGGWAAFRGKFKASWLLVEGSFIAVGIPGVILALTVMLLYLEVPIPIYGTVWIIVVAYVTRFLAYAMRLTDSAFRQLDPSLSEAGQVTGASPLIVQWKIIFPLMLPAVSRTWLWVAIRCIGELPIALILTSSGNQTLPVVLWGLFTTGTSLNDACAIAVVMAVVSGLGIWVLSRIGDRARTGIEINAGA
jgi:iron(III) transport system permease protein